MTTASHTFLYSEWVATPAGISFRNHILCIVCICKSEAASASEELGAPGAEIAAAPLGSLLTLDKYMKPGMHHELVTAAVPKGGAQGSGVVEEPAALAAEVHQ